MKAKLKNPIFIISSERSGSNLLRTLLDNHPLLYGPLAPQLLKTFDDILPFYGSSIYDLNLDKLFEDMKSVLNHPFHDWKIEKEMNEITSDANSFMDLWQAFYAHDLERNKASHIVCKENNIFDFAFQILQAVPSSKFIYLYRDPRDVCASWMKVPLGFKNVNEAAMNWQREQMKSIKAIKNYSLPVQAISYESLIEDTPKEMTRLLEGLGLPVDPACFQTASEKNKDLKWNKYWENLDKPVMTTNKGKYKKSLSNEEIEIIETRCKEVMMLLGYELDTHANWESPAPAMIDKVYYTAIKKRKGKYVNKQVETQVNEVLLDRAKLVKEIRTKRKNEWKVLKS